MMRGRSLDRFFLPESEDRARLPVALLTGSLGSGKTTLVNGLLRDPRMSDTAVAVNEFGAVPVDHHLIDHGKDRTVVLANGCLCCTVSGDLEDAVMRVFTRRAEGELPRFARLVVEPSGLADPAPIAQAILRNPGMSRALRLDGIVAVVDALFAERQLDEEIAAKQVMLADRIVVTKTDLADAAAVARVRARLAELNPAAPVLDVRHGQVDPAALFTSHFLDPTGPAPPALPRTLRTATAADPFHAAASRATVLLADSPVEWAALDAWLRRTRIRFADRLLRVKGIANVAGSARPVVLHGVHHVLHPPVALDAWPDRDRRTRLVLITRDVPEADLREGWDAVQFGVGRISAAPSATGPHRQVAQGAALLRPTHS